MRNGIMFLLSVCSIVTLCAQKPIIDFDAIRNWPTLHGSKKNISNDGRYILYMINNMPAKSSTLVVQSVKNDWKETFPNVGEGSFTADSKWLIFKSVSDSLCLLNLNSKKKKFIRDINSYTLPGKESREWFAYKKNDSILVVYNLISAKERQFAKLTRYGFNEGGTIAWLQTDDGSGNYSLKWLNFSDGQLTDVWKGGKHLGILARLRREQKAACFCHGRKNREI